MAADGREKSTINITLKDSSGQGIAGVIPRFKATDTGSRNIYGNCDSTGDNGASKCTLMSSYGEAKVLSLTYPLEKDGGSVTFTSGAADHLLKVAGDSQTAMAKTAVAQTLKVKWWTALAGRGECGHHLYS